MGSITNTSGERREPMGRISGRHNIKTAFLALYFAHHIMQKEILPWGAQ